VINPYHSLYFYSYVNSSRLRRLNIREAAIIYLSIIVYFWTLPIVVIGAHKLLEREEVPFLKLGCLIYGVVVYLFNKWHFEKKGWHKIILNHCKSTILGHSRLGQILAWLVLILSPVVFLLLLAVFW
jgi:hypothetical protein